MEALPWSSLELLNRMQSFEKECQARCEALNAAVDQHMAVNGIAHAIIQKRKNETPESIANKVAAVETHAIDKQLEEIILELEGSFQIFLAGSYQKWLTDPADFSSLLNWTEQDTLLSNRIKTLYDFNSKKTKLSAMGDRVNLVSSFKLIAKFPLPAYIVTPLFSAYTAELPALVFCKAFRLHSETYYEDPLLTMLVCHTFLQPDEKCIQDYFTAVDPAAFFTLSFNAGRGSMIIHHLNWFTFQFLCSSTANNGVGGIKFYYREKPLKAEALLEPAVITDVGGNSKLILPFKLCAWIFLTYAVKNGNGPEAAMASDHREFLILAVLEYFLSKKDAERKMIVEELVSILKKMIERRINIAHPELIKSLAVIEEIFNSKVSKRQKKPKFLDENTLRKQFGSADAPTTSFYLAANDNLKQSPLHYIRPLFAIPRETEAVNTKIQNLVEAFLAKPPVVLGNLVEKNRLETVVSTLPPFPVAISDLIGESLIVVRLAYLMLQFRDDRAMKKLFFDQALSFILYKQADKYFKERSNNHNRYSLYLKNFRIDMQKTLLQSVVILASKYIKIEDLLK